MPVVERNRTQEQYCKKLVAMLCVVMPLAGRALFAGQGDVVCQSRGRQSRVIVSGTVQYFAGADLWGCLPYVRGAVWRFVGQRPAPRRSSEMLPWIEYGNESWLWDEICARVNETARHDSSCTRLPRAVSWPVLER